MTRANPRNPLYALDRKIKRTRRELRRGIIRLMVNEQNDGQNPIDGQNPPTPTIGQNPHAPAVGLLNPLAPRTISSSESVLFEIIWQKT
ncbi:hypothetical protein GQ457_08G026030 [Hibiscus cannabinus]